MWIALARAPSLCPSAVEFKTLATALRCFVPNCLSELMTVCKLSLSYIQHEETVYRALDVVVSSNVSTPAFDESSALRRHQKHACKEEINLSQFV